MAFDLRAALLKKQEVESARLVDFEFRFRARSWRRVAEVVGLPAAAVAALIARDDDEGVLAAVAERTGRSAAEIRRTLVVARAEVRQALLAELGDPSPHRLA